MPRKYRKDYISRNGNNYYLQFHISEWMRQLPAFRNYPDGKKNFKWVLKGAGVVLALILVIKIFIFFDIKDLFLPIVGILIPVGMLYHWYSMSYDDEQKKIVKKLKGDD